MAYGLIFKSGQAVGILAIRPAWKGVLVYKVYGDMLSGNCYKIKLLMQFLAIQHEWVHVDILAGETHTEVFM